MKLVIALDNGTPVKFYATTLGTVTRDLKGAVGVYVLSPLVPRQPVRVRHHWVTQDGDTIFVADATAPTCALNDASATVNYTVQIIGGTGRFAGATGQLSNTAVLDTVHGTTVGRYHGTICFAQPEH